MLLKRLLELASRFGLSAPPARGRAWRRSGFRPGCDAAKLEPRVLQTVTQVAVSTAPQILFPPNGRREFVLFTGLVKEDRASAPPPVATFQVTDQYRLYEPVGFVKLKQAGPTSYSFEKAIPFPVSSSTRSNPEGRHFYITFTAANVGDANQFQVVAVFVPSKNQPPPKPKPPQPTASDSHGQSKGDQAHGKINGGPPVNNSSGLSNPFGFLNA